MCHDLSIELPAFLKINHWLISFIHRHKVIVILYSYFQAVWILLLLFFLRSEHTFNSLICLFVALLLIFVSVFFYFKQNFYVRDTD